MPEGLAKVPQWAWIALGVVALLAAPLALITDDIPAEGEFARLTPEQREGVQRVERLVLARDYEEAQTRLLSMGNFRIEGVPPLIQQLWRQLRSEPTAGGLELYALLLKRLVEDQHPFSDFALHLRRLRQMALVWGGTDLLDKLMTPIFMRPSFFHYAPKCHFDQIDHFILFERWQEADLTFEKQPLQTFVESGDIIDTRYRRLRRLIRLASAGRHEGARSYFRNVIDQAGSVLAGSAPGSEGRFQSWMRGVERYFADDAKVDRGSRQLQEAVDPHALNPAQVVYRLDYARALYAEAVLREARVQAEQLPMSGSDIEGADPNFTRLRVRHLFQIGWGAARLGDDNELRYVIDTLRKQGNQPEAVAYSQLLVGLREIGEGALQQGRERIARLMAGPKNPLNRVNSLERLVFERIAAGEQIPDGDPGRILFENGKRWGEFSDQAARVSRTVERLRTRVASPRDSAYLQYLEALDGFRNSRLDNARAKLMALLQAGPPQGLTRSEIAWLLVFAEEQQKELEGIQRRRERALEALAEVIGIDTIGTTEPLIARMLTLQVKLLDDSGDYLKSEEGGRLFDEVVAGVDQDGLPFPVIEAWLSLKSQLYSLANQQMLVGEFERSTQTLVALRRLGRDLPAYLEVEGKVLRGVALRTERTHPESVERHAELWKQCGEAFLAAAGGEFGNPELYFDAGEALLSAGEKSAARDALERYIPSRELGGDEHRYWQTLLYRIRLMRESGEYQEVAELIATRLNDEGLGSVEFELILERGRCYESLGRVADALADYNYIYTEMEAPNDAWYAAIYRKARIAQGLADRESATGTDAADTHRQTLAAWQELSTRLDQDRFDSRRAEALFHSGEALMVLERQAEARQSFDRLQRDAIAAEAEQLPASEFGRWKRYWETGIFGLGDAHFQLGEYQQAEAVYDRGIGLFPHSSLVPWGYHQLAECAAQQDRPDDALRIYALGTRIVKDLPAEAFVELPLNRGREFWLDAYAEKSRLLRKSKE